MPAPRSSILSTLGQDPYDYYETVRRQGDVVWDDGMKGWAVVSYESLLEKHLPHIADAMPVASGNNKYALSNQIYYVWHVELVVAIAFRLFGRVRSSYGWRRPSLVRRIQFQNSP